MKFLNKIIFINSADKSIRYAEINLDGNVHFIGTQGVGKSTLLRAILFFYNADKLKLGIPREKKSFDEYYFPYQNSYIIFEVVSDSISFCVLAFKSQGRVSFRFLDTQYDKAFFIDKEGKAFESWEKIRDSLGKNIGSTRIINSYEEYRNILYGNNKGLPVEFRKYAILESKQFQNIPRTITNVFLNTNLSAEFVKETIIKSLNEDELVIDLTTYSQTHLKDFETNLNDIKKWTDRNRHGENQVEKQADQVSSLFAALKFLENKKRDLAFQLGWALNHVKEQQPIVSEQLYLEEQKREKVRQKITDLVEVFNKKREKTLTQIGEFKSKIEEARNRKSMYEAKNIEGIIDRVSKKPSLELDKKNLIGEKEILTSAYNEIQQRFAALQNHLENQLKAFENNKQSEKISAKENLIHTKEELTKQYESIFENIRVNNKTELETANNILKEKEKTITLNRIKRSEVKNKIFYEKEIRECNETIHIIQNHIAILENNIVKASDSIKIIQKEWELEEKAINEDKTRQVEKQTEFRLKLSESISAIDKKISNSKDSLYGWLNEELPGWEKTIGKVIDEDKVLYKSGLHPQKIANASLNLYGITIDTNAIDKNVKTVSELIKEKEEYNKKVHAINQTITDIHSSAREQIEKIKKRFQLKLKEQREIIDTSNYQKDQNRIKSDATMVALDEWKTKAIRERKNELEAIENEFAQMNEEKTIAEEQVRKIENGIDKAIESKRKEKEKKEKEATATLDKLSLTIDSQINQERLRTTMQIAKLKNQQLEELQSKGANTSRIEEIDLKLSSIESELGFIDYNRDTVAEYMKDKRELFDKEDEFKNTRNLLERQLETDETKQKLQQEKLDQEITQHNLRITEIQKTLSIFNNDLIAFDKFCKTEIYQSIQDLLDNYLDVNQTNQSCFTLISDLNSNDNTITKRYLELQDAINKFAGNFDENNLFKFKVKFTSQEDYFEFAEMLREFIDENKISEFKKRVEERFASIIRRIGTETGDLISKEGEISQVIREINNDFTARKFVQAIKSMEMRTKESSNRIFSLLVEIKKFNDENIYNIGKVDLFNSNEEDNKNEKAISLLKQLIKEMAASKEKEITLSDSFELEFRIVENDNDSGWVEKLTNVGSEGTDILVKAMINIMLLNVFKERAAKKHKDDFRLHCMMDEIGKLHPNNVKGILKFANDRNILLINSSPTSYNATDYRYTYLLSKDGRNVTSIKRLIKMVANNESTKTTAL